MRAHHPLRRSDDEKVGKNNLGNRSMDRILISVTENGKHEVRINPKFLYLDTSAWINIFQKYVKHKEKIITKIAEAIENEFTILFSVVNFFELIGTKGDISINFSSNHLNAIERIRMTSANQPKIIIDQEVWKFINKEDFEIRILDTSHVALNKLNEGVEERKKGNLSWFKEIREWWDEINKRDRTLNLEADIIELSGIMSYPNFISFLRSRDQILSGPINLVNDRKAELIDKKIRYKGKKQFPSLKEELLKYARHRFESSLAEKYGYSQVSMMVSNPNFIFPGRDNIIRDIMSALELTFSKLKQQLPALYWSAKITYDNYYHRKQRSGGQFGDRNHAVYIPYSNYFATSDQLFVDVLKTEYSSIVIDGLNLFKIN